MSQTTHALHFDRVVDAPRPFVWRAWTEPDRLKRWYTPDDRWSTPLVEIDLRVGGAYRIGLAPPGASTFYEIGCYREVSRLNRLVYTLRFEGVHLHEPTGQEMEKYETVIIAEFEELQGGRTRVRIAHDGYRSDKDRDRHRNGWPRFLDQLAKYCATARVRSDESG